MADRIRSLSSPDLLPALESNMATYWMAYGRAPDAELAADDELIWMLTGVPEALFNGVFCARLRPEHVSDKLSDLHAAQARLQVPLLWWVGPTVQPVELGHLMAARGWAQVGTTPGMAVMLAELEDLALPEGVTVRRVDAPDELRLWGQIAGAGTGFSPQIAAVVGEMETYASGYPSRAERRNYIAYLRDEPVATSVLVLSHGVAGLYAVATLPAARRRGIGAAVSCLPLLEARAEGYYVGTLQASEMGRPVYRRLGFEDVCQFNMMLRRSDGATD